MTATEFRKLALRLPEAVEGAHHGHADFRVAGKVFASLGYPDETFGVVKLTPQDQDFLVRQHPRAFAPAAGKWGANGSTTVTLAAADRDAVASALDAAWRRRAPKRLIAMRDRDAGRAG